MPRLGPLLSLALAAAACDGGGATPDARDEGGDGGAAPDADVGPPAEVHLIGRFDGTPPGDVRFAWPGSTIRTRFTGTEISIALEDAGDNQFDVWLDGALQPVLVPGGGARTIELASGLADGAHDLVIARRTESFFGATTFRGFPGATLVATTSRTRRIELIGDSITCGYGVLGGSATCPFSADTEAETHAWGALAAAALGADHVAIAFSGKGAHRNYGGDTTDPMPALYDRVFADAATPTWGFDDAVDAVVINLGTNDFSVGDPGQPFVDAMTELVATVRARRPEAWIVVALSPMLGDGFPEGAMHRTRAGSYLQSVVAAAGPRVAYLELAEQQAADGYGCDYHPSAATQQLMADALETKLRELTGW